MNVEKMAPNINGAVLRLEDSALFFKQVFHEY